MAIPALAPSIEKSRKVITSRTSSRSILNLVPDLNSGETADRKSFVAFLSLVGGLGLIALLTINTLLAQDAFQLRKLQNQVTILNDQRDALIKQIATASSPEVLARKAASAGMIPSQSPRFLALPPMPEDANFVAPTSGAIR